MALASRRIKQFEIDPQELERQILSSMGNLTDTALLHTELTTSVKDIRTGSIVKATVDSVDEARTFYVDTLGFEHSMGVVGKDGQFDFVTVNREGARVMFSRKPEQGKASGARQPSVSSETRPEASPLTTTTSPTPLPL